MPELTVVVEQCLAPVPGGTGRYAREITAALAVAPPDGWRVRTVTAWHRDTRRAVLPGVDGPRRLPAGHRALNQLWQHRLPPWPRGTRIHATTPLAPYPLVPFGARPCVVTVHDAVPWTHPETLNPRGVRWHQVMVGRAMEQAEAVVVPSLAVADDLAGLFPAAADRLRVIPHGVTELVPPPDAADRRRKLGLPDEYLISVATLEPRKGLDVLIRALAHPAAPALPLVVVGPGGWGGVDLAAEVARAGLAPDRLHTPGRLEDPDLASALSAATALVAPSRSEGFGLPVLEAMAAGVPVVCSDAPALVEVSGGAAVVVPRDDATALAEALRGLVGDAGQRAEMADRGQRRAAEFSWRAAAEQLWQLHIAGPSVAA